MVKHTLNSIRIKTGWSHINITSYKMPKYLLASCLAASLVACGGGGGSGDGDSVTPPVPSTGSPSPVVPAGPSKSETTANSLKMTSISTSSVDHSVLIADAAAQFLRNQSQNFVNKTNCANGGQINWTLSDADSNSVLSVGDTLTGTILDCSLVTDTYRGTLTLLITQPLNLGTGHSAFTTTANLERYETTSTTWLPITGSFSAQIFSSVSKYNLALSFDNTGLSLANTTSASGPVERIFNTTLTRNNDLIAARYTLSVNGKIASATLGDVITVRTPSTLQGYLVTNPDTGSFSFKTKLYTATLSSNNIVNNSSANYSYDTLNKGVIDSPAQLISWFTLGHGFMFSFPRPYNMTVANSTFQLLVNGASNSLVLLDISGPGYVDPISNQFTTWTPTPKFIYQFSRPLDSTRLPNFQLLSTTTTTIPSANGAQLHVTPSKPLVAGIYSYAPTGSGLIFDQSGAYTSSVGPINFTVPDALTAKAVADTSLAISGTVVNLDASTSVSTVGDITSYSWKQIGGTVVSLQNSNTAKPSFTVPAISGSGLLQFQVTVTNSAGFVKTATVKVYAYQDVSKFVLLDFKSDVGDYIGGGQSEAYLADSGLTFSGSRNLISVALPYAASRWWNLDISSPTQFKIGTYNATRYPFNGSLPGLDFSGSGRGCNTSKSTFTILDIAYDGSGSITRLAVDFTQHCEGGVPALHGRYRYHSVANL